MNEYGFNTGLLHGTNEKYPQGATQVPIYQSSAFRHDSAEDLEKIFDNKKMGFSYTRINNPTVESFEKRVTMLEDGIGSVACASGMAALTNAFLNILQAGDEIVAACGLYGGTVELFDDLKPFGISVKYVKENKPEAFEAEITEKTRIVFAETIGNPKLDVTDIQAVAEVAHKYDVPLIVDNTVATPYLIRPLKLGADIVIHSSSKYINGSSDAISGILVCGKGLKWDPDRYPGLAPYRKFGPFAYIAKLRNGLFRNTGACLAPQNAFLNNLGLETLGLRMQRQCDNALELARFLQGLGGDIEVNYPGLEESPYHEIAEKQFKNGYGAIVTVRTGSKEKAFSIINSLKIPLIISNIGDTKTLVIHPESTIAAHISDKEKQQSGVFEDLIRISVGIEDIEDLKEDFKQAIENNR
ncbi:O-acetylhomoserine aminocarboxypropyltransferase/cysteine synthase family protein [Blautia massiliensis (ex Durand et al. 2017)]|uniref:O-acetylhomoserine aminocarboxypropyltransferase/cysteine synthase family protein n=1 Tax=Blautia massiliensis (ex Durand et al. 2017) TaxID=1737424 RepID=UPI0022E5105B|nr:PLP-dependent transferase [Blautia massiliensis (ex Durand et al. 2017)]